MSGIDILYRDLSGNGMGVMDLDAEMLDVEFITPEAFGAFPDGSDASEGFNRLVEEYLLPNRGAYIKFARGATYRFGSNYYNQAGSLLLQTAAIRAIGEVDDWLDYLYVDLNGATLKRIDGGRYGSFNFTTWAALPDVADYVGAGRVDISHAIEGLYIRDVRIMNGDIDGNAQTLTVGGWWGDAGWQVPGSGIKIDEYEHLLIDNVHVRNTANDCISITTSATISSNKVQTHIRNSSGDTCGRNCLTVTGGNGILEENNSWRKAGGIQAVNRLITTPPKSCRDLEAEGPVVRNVLSISCDYISGQYTNTALVEDSGDTANTMLLNCNVEGNLWSSKPGFIMKGGELRGKIGKILRDALFEDVTFKQTIVGTWPLPAGFTIVGENAVPEGQYKLNFVRCHFELTDRPISLRDAVVTNCTANIAFDTRQQPDGTTAINFLSAEVEGFTAWQTINPAYLPAGGYYINDGAVMHRTEIVDSTRKLMWVATRPLLGLNIVFTGPFSKEKLGTVPSEFLAGPNVSFSREVAGTYRGRKDTGGAAWDANFYSQDPMEGDFVIEFRSITTPANSAIGVTIGNPTTNASYTNINFNVALTGGAGTSATAYLGGAAIGGSAFTISERTYFVRRGNVLAVYSGTSYRNAISLGPKYTFVPSAAGAAYANVSMYAVGTEIEAKMGSEPLFAYRTL